MAEAPCCDQVQRNPIALFRSHYALDADKVKLLCAKGADENSALQLALEYGHVEVLEQFGNALAHSGLSRAGKLKVFAAVKEDGTSALLAMMPSEDIAKAYGKAAQSLGLANEQAVKDVLTVWG